MLCGNVAFLRVVVQGYYCMGYLQFYDVENTEGLMMHCIVG